MSKVLQAFKSGDKRATLVAIGENLAYGMDTTGSERDRAALSNNLMKVIDRLDALPPADGPKTDFDRLRERVGR